MTSPEAYAIEKDGHDVLRLLRPAMPPDDVNEMPAGIWSGEVELRGLGSKTYHVTDYVHGKDYGTVTGPTAKLNVEFHGSVSCSGSHARAP